MNMSDEGSTEVGKGSGYESIPDNEKKKEKEKNKKKNKKLWQTLGKTMFVLGVVIVTVSLSYFATTSSSSSITTRSTTNKDEEEAYAAVEEEEEDISISLLRAETRTDTDTDTHQTDECLLCHDGQKCCVFWGNLHFNFDCCPQGHETPSPTPSPVTPSPTPYCAKTCERSCLYNKFDGTNNCCDQKAVCESFGASMVCSLSGGSDCASV